MRKRLYVFKGPNGEIGFQGQLVPGDRVLSFCGGQKKFIMTTVDEEVCDYLHEYCAINDMPFPSDLMFYTKDRGWEQLSRSMRRKCYILTDKGKWEQVVKIDPQKIVSPLYYCSYTLKPSSSLSINGFMTITPQELEYINREENSPPPVDSSEEEDPPENLFRFD